VIQRRSRHYMKWWVVRRVRGEDKTTGMEKG